MSDFLERLKRRKEDLESRQRALQERKEQRRRRQKKIEQQQQRERQRKEVEAMAQNAIEEAREKKEQEDINWIKKDFFAPRDGGSPAPDVSDVPFMSEEEEEESIQAIDEAIDDRS